MNRLGILALSDPSKGGTFQYTLSVLKGLRHVKNWEITLYTTSNNEGYNDAGFPVRHVASQLDRRLPSVMMDLIGRSRQDPFVDEDAVMAPIYSPVLLHTKKPFVYTLHDLQELYYPEHFTYPQRVWRRFIHSRLTKRASRIICESRFVQADIAQAFQVQPERIDIIVAPPLPMKQVDEGIESISAVRKKYDLPKKYLFYPAQFWTHKNHLRLIEAFSRVVNDHPDCHLLLTGKKRDEYERVFQRVGELGLQGRVKHIGYIDQQDMAVLYREAVALVMPSLYESVSIPVFEAFQLGTPVAVSNIVALPEQVGGAGLLFDPLSVEAIEKVIKKLLDDPDLLYKLSDCGRQRYAALSFEKNGAEMMEMLARLTDS